MRLLLIHSDSIEYSAKKETPVAETDVISDDSLTEALVVFCAVEAVDEDDPEDVMTRAVAEIKETVEKLGTTNIMIYPYAHLASNLSSPDVAVAVMKGMESALLAEGTFTVKRAPFGWYKAFTLSCKGHPLSELSRTILPGGDEEKAKQSKKEVAHEFFVLTPDGSRHDATDFADTSAFGRLVSKEIGLGTETGGEIHLGNPVVDPL